ncbi:MAG: PorV/PorQ family protein [candidate division KSB1 bacterium]|nr:PorV/PorQ family protein [candidate division KSB1 bacterium]
MKNIIVRALMALLVTVSLGRPQTFEKIAQTGCQFLSVSSDAKASALAEAATSLEMGSASLFFNPAGMATLNKHFDITLSMNRWIADIRHNTLCAAFSPARGRYGVFGATVQSVDYGDIIWTTVANNEKGFIDSTDPAFTGGIGDLGASAVGFGYSRALSDRFSVGGQVKWVHQQLGANIIPTADSTKLVKNELSPLAFDFGTLYKTGFKSLQFGMSVRNFSKEVRYAQEGFQLPLVFTLGISMNLLDLVDWQGVKQSAVLSIDAAHDRSHREQLLVGLDYTLMDILSLRIGYVAGNDENDITYGVGISYFGVVFDYAYTPFGVFDNVQRISARFSL